MTYWKPLQIGNNTYDISHLEPFSFQLLPTHSSELALIVVKFNDHCFTEAFNPEKHNSICISNRYSHHEKRGFCIDRYNLSKRLPDLIRNLDGKRISQTRFGDLVRVELENGNSYGIFFNLRRIGPKSCDLFVMSAYPFDTKYKMVAATGEMKFNVAVALILAGKRPRFPPRN